MDESEFTEDVSSLSTVYNLWSLQTRAAAFGNLSVILGNTIVGIYIASLPTSDGPGE